MKTKHILFGAAGAAFAGLVANTFLSSNDNETQIPDNLTGTATLQCKGTLSPVRMEDDKPILIKEGTIDANNVSILLNFNNGKVAGWSYIPPQQDPQNPRSNLEFAGEAICPYKPQDCTPHSPSGEPIKLFEYAYLIEKDDEAEQKYKEIKGYGILSPDFRYYAGLQSIDGELTASSLSCEVQTLTNAYAVK